MKVSLKRLFAMSLLSFMLVFSIVAPAMAVTYSGPNTYAPVGGPHYGTTNYGSGNYWVLDTLSYGTHSMSFTNSSSRLLDVVVYGNGGTLYSGKLGSGTHSIPLNITSFSGSGPMSMMVFNGVLDGSFASASYSFMYY